MPLVIRFGIFFIFFLCHHLTLIASEDSLFCPDRNITIEIPGPESTGNYFLFGKVSKKRLHLGFQSIDLAETSVTLSSSTNSIEMAKNKFVSPAVFLVKNSNPLLSDKVTWKLQILDASLNVADTLNGRGKLPEKIIWAKPGSDARVVWNKSYFYFLKVSRIDGSFSFSTRPRPFIIFAVTTLKHRISTSALSSYKKIYEDTRFQAFLGKLAVTINKYKEKKWNLVAYMKKDQPLLCDNVFRLRNYLVTKHRIPIKRFHTFCDFVEGVVPDENYVSLVGTRPKKDVSLARFKERKSHDVETGGGRFNFITNEPFIIWKMRKEKASRATLFELPDIYVTFGSGEKIFIKPDPAKVVLEIKTGKNLVNNHMISLYDGLENIYCGKLKEKTSLLKATTGFYMLSDTLYPGDPHFLVFTAGMRKNLRSFFDSLAPSIGMNPKKFNLDIDFTAIPKNLVGSKRSSQSFYRFTGMIGYDITLANFNPGFYVGYLYYTSKDNYYGDTGLIGVLGSPFVAITLLYKYRIAEKFILQNILKLFPAILKQLSAFGFENVLSLEYPLGKSRSLYFDYRKTIFRYSKKDPEESVLENMDSFLCGAGIKF